MAYTKTTFVNGGAPAIGAEFLNGLQEEVVNLGERETIRTATKVVGLKGVHSATEVDYLADNAVGADVAINAAIQALPATGGSVLIREGAFEIKATILMSKTNVTLEGCGNATLLKRMFASSSPEHGFIHLPPPLSNIVLKNFSMDGKKESYPYSPTSIHACISTQSGAINNVKIENVAMFNCGGTCIELSTGINSNTSKNVLIHKCTFSNSYEGYNGECHNITIDNCLFTNMSNCGICLAMNSIFMDSRGCIIENNIFTENKSGISTPSAGGSISGPYLKNAIISNNIFDLNNAGVIIFGNISGVIADNFITKASYSTAEYSIFLNSYSSNILLSSNYCLDKPPVIDGAKNVTNVNNKS